MDKKATAAVEPTYKKAKTGENEVWQILATTGEAFGDEVSVFDPQNALAGMANNKSKRKSGERIPRELF